MRSALALFLATALSAAAAETAPATPLPPGHVKTTPRALDTLRKWDHSAVTDADRGWWAFQPLHRAEAPKVHDTRWIANPIDAFVLAPIEAKHLKPAASADRRTLARRASFDLLGIPPTPAQLDAFVRDTSRDAWTRYVVRLLDTPGYGERWGRHWLDVARFAESSGFEHDYDRPNAHHYRDFVIKALEADMPFDQFVRWQIAGDEFEPDNPQALMATGFLGAGVFPTQITANEVERVRYDAMDDMLATTGSAMLGLTIGCARCHDHKFDPIPTRDYYRMLATFTTTVRSDIDLDLQPEANRAARELFDREHAPLISAVKGHEESVLPARFASWIASGAPRPAAPTWQVLEAKPLASKAGATFRRLDDGSYLAEGANGDSDVYTFDAIAPEAGLRSLRLEALSHHGMVHGGPGRADNGNIGLSRIRVYAWPDAGGTTNEIALVRPRATFEQNAANLAVATALDTDPHTGWAIDPKFGTNHAAIFDFAAPVGTGTATRLRVQLEFALNTRHNIGRPRLSVSTADHPDFGGDTIPAEIASILPKVAAALTAKDRAALFAWWKTSDAEWRGLNDRVEEHARKQPKPKLTKVLVCAEGYPALRMHTQGADFFPETYLLQRGSPDQKRGVATPGFLQVLAKDGEPGEPWKWSPPDGAKFSGRRRTLASWMTDPNDGAGHLLARVIVNRLWQHHFGQGLVATPNDFGAQGTRPSHPELLDWLASELIRNGWRLKPIHRLIMDSSAYRIASKPDPKAAAVDPANALFARRVPQRLEAEAIRDSLLFVAGVLDTNRFGPGTLDESSRRRSVYFTVKRSQLVPSMQSFDAPEPLVSQGTRPTTTVAPQALILMNSPHVRTWAAAFASRIAPGADTRLPDAVDAAYSLALNRAPDPRERADGIAFVEGQIARHRGDGRKDPRAMALADFAQVVLSLDEFVYAD